MALISQAIQQQTSDVTYVDLSPKTATSKVVREGFEVPAATANSQKAQFFIDQLPAANTKIVPRVVTQSIAAGVQVARGTVIDLVMAPKQLIPWSIFDNVFADLNGKTLDFMDDVLDDPNVRQVVLQYDSPDQLPAAQRKIVTDAYAKKGFTVNDADPTRTFALAFDSARVAAAYR